MNINKHTKKRRHPTKKPTWRDPDNEIREPEFHHKYYAEDDDYPKSEGLEHIIIDKPLRISLW